MTRHRTLIRLSAALAGVALVWACGGDSPTAPPTPEPARPATVTVSPATADLTALGATVQLTAEVRDQNARVMAGATVTWSSGDTSVATVDASGLVTAVGNGTATITASGGSASGSAVVTVTQSVATVEVSPSVETIAWGSTLQLTAEGFDENGDAVESVQFSWESSDVAIATVDASGLVAGVAVGVATITASAGSGQGTAEITVTDPDRAALVALYDATGGPNWNHNDNWLTDAPLGDWYGVEVDDQGRVIGLHFQSNRLTGRLPPELGSLANLRSLFIWLDGTTGPIPPELGNLANLQSLRLMGRSSHLTGPIPPELGRLANLQILELWNNDLTGPIPPELGRLTNLNSLHLSKNDLTGPIPPELGGLADLRSLNLTANRLTGPIPPELGGPAYLESLYLGENKLTGPVPAVLGGLMHLRHLALQTNASMSGALPPA